MNCTTCGAVVESTAVTCPVCGSAVAEPAAGDTTGTGTPAPDRTDGDAAVGGTGVGGTGVGGTGAGGSGAGGSGAGGSGAGGSGAGGTGVGGTGAGGSANADRSAGYGSQSGYGTSQPPGSGGQPSAYGGPPSGYDPQPVWGGAPPPLPHPSGLAGDVRGWGIAAHLAGLGAALATAAIFGFVGPLIVWLVKRDEHPFIDHHAKEALNFQLTVLVALVGAALLAIPAVIVGALSLGLGLLLVAGAVVVGAIVAWLVFLIVGAVKASNGEGYRYPLTIRFIR